MLAGDVLAGRDDDDMGGRDRTGMLANTKWERGERQTEAGTEKQRKTERGKDRWGRDREVKTDRNRRDRDRQIEAETKKETDRGRETKMMSQRDRNDVSLCFSIDTYTT